MNDRPAVEFVLNDSPYEVGMVFTDDQGYDYDATAAAIYEAVVASTTPALTAADVTVEYNMKDSVLSIHAAADQDFTLEERAEDDLSLLMLNAVCTDIVREENGVRLFL